MEVKGLNKFENYLIPGIGRIYSFVFDKNVNLSSTLMRFQEYYESPKYNGIPFTINEFKEYYKGFMESTRFTYNTDWSGCNFPDNIVKDFLNGKFKRMTKKEKLILSYFKDVDLSEKFYVIGSSLQEEEESFKHEFCHALYYLDEDYKKEVDEILSSMDFSKLKEILMDNCYDEKVMNDELNAYLTINPDFFVFRGASVKKYSDIINKLSGLFKNRYNAIIK